MAKKTAQKRSPNRDLPRTEFCSGAGLLFFKVVCYVRTMKERQDNLGEQELGGIKDVWKKLKSKISGAGKAAAEEEKKPVELSITDASKSQKYQSFGEYMQAEGQARIRADWESKLKALEKQHEEFGERYKKFAESADAVDRETYRLKLKSLEEDINHYKKLLGLEK